jgi:hypothetical protein
MMALAARITPGACDVPLGILAELWGIGEKAQVPALCFLAYVSKGAINPAVRLPLFWREQQQQGDEQQGYVATQRL